MSMRWCLKYYFLVALNYFNIVQTAPPDYCFSNLNTSNCNMPPKPVFHYYKPGSRCEVDIWRGCPTLNMFEDEYECSLTCIYRHKLDVQPVSECDIPISKDICTNDMVTVFTHENGKCIETEWGGCPTQNKFQTKEECDRACHTVVEEPVVTKLEELDEKSLEVVKEILDQVEEELAPQTEAEVTETTTHVEEELPPTTEANEEVQSETEANASNDEYEEVLYARS